MVAMNEPLDFGELLRRYRIHARLTQEGLAERAGLAARTIRSLGSFGIAAHFCSIHDELRDHFRYHPHVNETVSLTDQRGALVRGVRTATGS